LQRELEEWLVAPSGSERPSPLRCGQIIYSN
jgi:hypothetical protein